MTALHMDRTIKLYIIIQIFSQWWKIPSNDWAYVVKSTSDSDLIYLKVCWIWIETQERTLLAGTTCQGWNWKLNRILLE